MITCSIIIVNYKSAGLVLDCLRTILPGTPGGEIEVIIVDNYSQDDSENIIRSVFPQVQWIQMDYNSGFARANNAGIRVAKGEAVLLLNPDTLNKDSAVEKCCKHFLASDYVACGVQLLNPDGTPQISGNYFMKGGLNHLLPLPYVGTFLKGIANLAGVKKPNVANAASTVEVDWINGAFLMAKRNIIDQAGLLDEDFFMYAEEAEWCSRLGKFGKLCLFGNYHVIHYQGVTANEVYQTSGRGYMNIFDRKGFQLMISNLLRVRKQFGAGWFLFHLLVLFGTIPVFFIGLLFSKLLRGSKASHSWRQFAGFSRNTFGVLKYAGRIIRNKPYFYKIV